MAKLKKPKLDINKKEKAFVYEIIGIFAIIIAIISLAKFGLIGKYLVLSFSLLFGDWYFVFIILIGIFGIYCLIFHKKFELKSIRYYGVILILLSMLILTHFSMHNYISYYDGNPLVLTFKIYLSYFRSGSYQMIDGGGIIGCVCFYIFYYLLGKVGTIIISFILFFVGIVFLTKKTMKEFIEIIIKIFKKIGSFTNKKYKRFINGVKEISLDYENKSNILEKIRNKKKHISIKKEKNTFDETQVNRCEELVIIISDIINHLSIEYENINYLLCEHIVVFFIKTKQDINYNVLETSLKNKIKEDFLIKYDSLNEQVLIEVSKLKPRCLSIYKAKQMISKQEFSIVFGIDDRNLIIELEDNSIIIGSNSILLEKYLLSIILFCQLQKKFINNSLVVLDTGKQFNFFNIDNVLLKQDVNFLDTIVDEINKNLELLNLHHKKDIEEYNLFFKDKIIKKYIIIHKIENIIYDINSYDKLLYIVQTGKMAGINVILTLNQDVMLSNILLSSIGQKILLNNMYDITNKFIDTSFFLYINNDVEAFYKDKDLVLRMSILMLNKEEEDKIKKIS